MGRKIALDEPPKKAAAAKNGRPTEGVIILERGLALFVMVSSMLYGQDVQETLNLGIAAFQRGNSEQAVEFFQKAVSADPNNLNAHLYLGSAYMAQSNPGAVAEFRRALELDGNNVMALASMASIAFTSQNWAKAMDWNKRIIAADPKNKRAITALGVIVWSELQPTWLEERARAHMAPSDTGPLPAEVREKLKAHYSSVIEEGIANVDRALTLDPRYADAMGGMGALIHLRADLRDTREDYLADVAAANEWANKSLAARKTPERVPQTLVPVVKVDPVYPPLALQARVQGTVRFMVTIGSDGTISNIRLVSGHPLLVEAARDAVKKYEYNPVMENGAPVEAVTTVDIYFVLKN